MLTQIMYVTMIQDQCTLDQCLIEIRTPIDREDKSDGVGQITTPSVADK